MIFQITVFLGALFSASVLRADVASEGSTTSNSAREAATQLRKVDAADDVAQTQVEQWTRENQAQKAKGGGLPDDELERRIATRFEPVRKAYEDLVKKFPNSAAAHLAYGSFLNARQDERSAQGQWEQALKLDPNNPVIYNCLAGRYSESGPVEKALQYFGKAIALNPGEPAYYHNFGDALFVLRKHAALYYRINEQEVYGRCLSLYSNAVRLEPNNFTFAKDLAQTYYSLKPFEPHPASVAWTNALRVARTEEDRQDVYVHLARVKMLAGAFAEARAQLSMVTDEHCLEARSNLLRHIEERERETKRR